MTATLGSVFPVFALILAGWAAGRRGLFDRQAIGVLNGFVVRLALPALLFQFVAEADWPALWQPGFLAAMIGGIALTFVAGFALGGGREAGRSVADRSIAALAAAYANTAFIGIPIGQALFGAVGLAAAVIASLLTVCLSFAFAILLVEIDLHRAKGVRGAAAEVGRSLARNPLVIGPAAGALWAVGAFWTGGGALPDPLHRLAVLLGAAASPVALVTIGLFLAHAPPAPAGSEAMRLAALKLVAQPLATAGLALLFGVPGRWAAAAILIAALPTGTGPFMLATLYGRDAGVAARVILVTTILAAFSVSLLAVMLD